MNPPEGPQGWGVPPGPPGPPPGPSQHPSGLSTGAQVAIGAVTGPFVVGAFAYLLLIASTILAEATTETAFGVVAILGGLVALAGLVAGIAWWRTRWFAVGALIGVAVVVIVLAGACVALIASLDGMG